MMRSATNKGRSPAWKRLVAIALAALLLPCALPAPGFGAPAALDALDGAAQESGAAPEALDALGAAGLGEAAEAEAELGDAASDGTLEALGSAEALDALAGTGTGSPDTYSGSDLWLRYVPVADAALLAAYRAQAKSILVPDEKAAPVFRFADQPLYLEAYGKQGIQQAEGSVEVVPKTTLEAARLELSRALDGLLSQVTPVSTADEAAPAGAVVVGTPETSAAIAGLALGDALAAVGGEGYVIKTVGEGAAAWTAIAANTEIGALYGTYAFLRLIQTEAPISPLDVSSKPKVNHRRLDGWDRERMYAGNGNAVGGSGLNGESGCIFNFSIPMATSTGSAAHSTAPAVLLPVILDRYVVFARACASIGINEINPNNVNTNSGYLTEYVIREEAALMDALRPYGIKLSLSVNYGMPTMPICNYQGDAYPKDATSAIGAASATTCDPQNPEYQNWWYDKSRQIIEKIPDFLGYTVKANSEGQAGPQTYGYTHAEGANGMAARLQELGLTVFWRSFVYNATVDNDRLNRAYMEFGPADDPDDGKDVSFLPNVFVQTKNGPLDFQPREPFHPMFGRMPNTNQAVEFQITKEYLGQNKSLQFLAPMWEEFFKSDTYANGPGTPVGAILDGTAQGQADTAIVGVHNLGNSDNFTGHHFDQANFYAFGRQAWDWTLESEQIAGEWARMTWGNDPEVVGEIVPVMMGAREATVSYQEPLGLMHQQAQSSGNHYGPGSWDWASQDDWGPRYYNKADASGIGWDRTVEGRIRDLLPVPEEGSEYEKYYPLVNQYFPQLRDIYADIDECPEELILAFHHVPWDYIMDDGLTLWEELVYLHQMGVQYVTGMIEAWDRLEGKIDARRFAEVRAKLLTQEADAARWRDESIKYWALVNGLDVPTDTAPLSVKVTVAGKQYGGFDLSWGIDPNSTAMLAGTNSPASALYRQYVIAVPYGTEDFTITAVEANDGAVVTVDKQASGIDGTAQVTARKADGFGETVRRVTGDADAVTGSIVQRYTFAFAYDTSLAGVEVNGVPLASFDPKKTSLTAYVREASASVEATAADPAATVTVAQPASLPGEATVTVENHGAPATTYTIMLAQKAAAGSDEFGVSSLGGQWAITREDAAAWSLTKKPGSLTITTQRGDLRGTSDTTSNNAKNLVLQAAPAGDWAIETKAVFSRPPATLYEQGGLVAYTDDDNYITLGWQIQNVNAAADSQSGKYNVNMVREQNGTATAYNSQGIDMQRAAGLNCDTIWLRIVKKGDTYSGYFSADGENYKLCKLYSSFPATPSLPTLTNPPAKVGVYAFNRDYDSATPLDVSFEYFRIETLGEEVAAPGGGAPLEGLVANAGAIVAAAFTDDTRTAYEGALAAAHAVLADASATPTATNQAIAALDAAIGALEPKPALKAYSELVALLLAVARMDGSIYTEASWSNLASVAAEAWAMVAGAAAATGGLTPLADVPAAILVMTRRLQEAILALQLKAPGEAAIASPKAVKASIVADAARAEFVYEDASNPPAAKFHATAKGAQDIGSLSFYVSFKEGSAGHAFEIAPALAGVARIQAEPAPAALAGYETWSVYVFANDGPFSVADGDAVFSLTVTPAGTADRSETAILSHFDAAYYDASVGGGIVGIDADASIEKAVAIATLVFWSKYDVNRDGQVTLADVNQVRQYLGAEAGGDGAWASAAAKACDLTGAPAPGYGPDGKVTLDDLMVIIAAYENAIPFISAPTGFTAHPGVAKAVTVETSLLPKGSAVELLLSGPAGTDFSGTKAQAEGAPAALAPSAADVAAGVAKASFPVAGYASGRPVLIALTVPESLAPGEYSYTVRVVSKDGAVLLSAGGAFAVAAAGGLVVPLASAAGAADIFVDAADWPGIAHAAQNLAADIKAVTGAEPAFKDDPAALSEVAVIAGAIGHSPVIDKLVADGLLDVSEVEGQWEAYVTTYLEDPLPGVKTAYVIAGADKRGAVYGIYDISEAIGVSPWTFFGDSAIPHKDAVEIAADPRVQGSPSVQYRGIFINDERQTEDWLSHLYAGEIGDVKNPTAYHGFNHQYYDKLFDLILRMKGNFLWPAMWNNAFFDDDPLNPQHADEWGVVIGTTHHEFMSRSDKEWNWLTAALYGGSGLTWAYYDNVADPSSAVDPVNTGVNTQEVIKEYWRTGIRERKGYEQVVTLGLRGQEDTAALPSGSMAQQIELLTDVVTTQREIIAEECGGDPTALTQAVVLYNEVDRFYYAGYDKQVPDDVIVIVADDLHGNTRALPSNLDRDRAGGFGMYYHFEINGGPRSDRYVDTMPLEKLREQMTMAYDYGVQRLWLTNVGNLKFNEVPTEYWLKLAYDIDAWRDLEAPDRFTELFAAREFGEEVAEDTAQVISDYVQMNNVRWPEILYPNVYSATYFDEAQNMLAKAEGIIARSEALYERVQEARPAQKDAFYEMVLYPARASSNILKLMASVALHQKYYNMGALQAAAGYAAQARAALEFDNEEMRYWKTIQGGKWTGYFPVDPPNRTLVNSGTGTDANIYHIGLTTWNHPEVQFSFATTGSGATRLYDAVPEDGSELIVIPQSNMGSTDAAKSGEVSLYHFTSYNDEERYVEIANGKADPFAYTLAASDPWIVLGSAGGTCASLDKVSVKVDWSKLPAGVSQAQGTITVSGAGAQVTVRVTADVEDPALLASLPPMTFVETDGYASILSKDYAASVPAPDGPAWTVLPDYGRELSSMKVQPQILDVARTPGVDSPYLEYRVYVKTPGKIDIVTQWAPTTGPNAMHYTKMQYGVSFGEGDAVKTVNTLSPVFLAQNTGGATWPIGVETATRTLSAADGSVCWSTHEAAAPGVYTLRIYMIDDGMTLQKILVGTERLTERADIAAHAGTLRCNPETREVFDAVDGSPYYGTIKTGDSYSFIWLTEPPWFQFVTIPGETKEYNGELLKQVDNYEVAGVQGVPALFIGPASGSSTISGNVKSFFGPPETYHTPK